MMDRFWMRNAPTMVWDCYRRIETYNITINSMEQLSTSGCRRLGDRCLLMLLYSLDLGIVHRCRFYLDSKAQEEADGVCFPLGFTI